MVPTSPPMPIRRPSSSAVRYSRSMPRTSMCTALRRFTSIPSRSSAALNAARSMASGTLGICMVSVLPLGDIGRLIRCRSVRAGGLGDRVVPRVVLARAVLLRVVVLMVGVRVPLLVGQLSALVAQHHGVGVATRSTAFEARGDRTREGRITRLAQCLDHPINPGLVERDPPAVERLGVVVQLLAVRAVVEELAGERERAVLVHRGDLDVARGVRAVLVVVRPP